MTRRKVARAIVEPVPQGFPVQDIDKFGKKVATVVQRKLELPLVRHVQITVPRGKSLRLATNPAMLRDSGGRFPVLQIRAPTERDGVYLETAIDYDWVQGRNYLTHVSLKLFFGPAPGAAALKFRAEWDPRAQAHTHAQPHWNIDTQIDPEIMETQEDHPPWVPEPISAPWVPVVQLAHRNSPKIDLAHFHFAMSATWQTPTAHHSAKIEDDDALVRWISGCISYIRDQLHHRKMS
jgi:hypothetical protein